MVIVTFLYFTFGVESLEWFEMLGILLFLGFWNLGLMGLGGFLLIRGLGKDLKGLQKSIKFRRRGALAMVGLIGFLYCLIIFIQGLEVEPEAYLTWSRLVEFIVSILYSYAVIPVFMTSLLLDSWVRKVKDQAWREFKITFEPEGRRLGRELLLAFSLVAIYPLASIGLSLWTHGFLESILNVNPYLVSNLLILLFVGSVIVLNQTWTFSEPIHRLSTKMGQIGEGDFQVRLAVSEANEIGALESAINVMAEGLQERERIRDLFGRVVDPTVRDLLLKDGGALGGRNLNLTILFTDLRGFTSISERMEPSQVVNLLNSYLSGVSHIVSNRGGVVNKFIGDAVLAVFGLEAKDNGTLVENTLQALKAALDIQAELQRLNQNLGVQTVHLEAGIGIHTGRVLAGNIGSENRMEFTVIGDAVNLASRLEGLTKELGVPILVSQETVNHLPPKHGTLLRPLSDVQVKGRQQFVQVYSLESKE